MDFSEDRFNEIKNDYEDFAKNLNIKDIRCVPLSALDGDNIVNRTERSSWYQGQTLMEILETVEISDDKNVEHFRFPVQYVNRPNLDFRGFCGTVASGIVRKGDSVMALPSRKTSTVDKIVTFDGDIEEAFIDQAVTITLKDEIDVSRGDMLVHIDDVPAVASKVNADLVWMSEDGMAPGKAYDIKFSSQSTQGAFSKIHHRVDVNTLEQHDAEDVKLNEIALCELSLTKPIAFDAYQKNRATGAFIVVDRLTNVTVGAGMVVGEAADDSMNFEPVTAKEKAARFGQKPAIVAINGTHAEQVATALDRRLFEMGKVAAIANHENAQCLKDAGLVALVVGGADKAKISLAADEESLDSMIASLQDKGII